MTTLLDIVAIHKQNTISNHTKLHFISAMNRYQQFSGTIAIPLECSDDRYDFHMVDWNGDGSPDLVIIIKSGTGSGMTEIHVLSGASGFQEYILHTSTGLGPTNQDWEFGLADWEGDGKLDLFPLG